jgi:hypothetical protein
VRFRRQTDRHVALVVGDVIDAVGDRLGNLGVREVMALDLDRLPGRLPLAPGGLVIADQFLLLTVDTDHGLPGAQRRLDRLVDVLKLPIAVEMLGALPRLVVGLKPEPCAVSSFPSVRSEIS